MARSLPAEWAPQDAVLLIWPHADSDWRDDLEAAERAFATLALAILRFRPLIVACHDQATRERARESLQGPFGAHCQVTTVMVPSNDTWARDIAPITVCTNDGPLCIDCNFNGWGGKYEHALDTRFASGLLASAGFEGLAGERVGLVLEGGSIDSDGDGTLLINRRTVLDSARNPDLDRPAAERLLQEHFGARRVLWVDVPPVPGDDTDGHIDTLARFTETGAVAFAAPHSSTDPAAPTLNALRRQLSALRDADGAPFELVPLPGPLPFSRAGGTPCPATYANFLVLDGAVLVPAYADANDAVAVERLQSCFPGRTILPVPARTFVQQAGSIHCLTMQWPEGTLGGPAHD